MARLSLPSRIAGPALVSWALLACGNPENGRASARTPEAAAPPSGARGGSEGSAVAAAGRAGTPPRFAKGFSFEPHLSGRVATVHRPWQGASGDRVYFLVPRSERSESPFRPPGGDTLLVRVPVRRAVSLTTTNLPHLEWTDALDALVGLGGARYACSPEVRERLADGRIRDVGEDVRLDLEALVVLRPEITFTYVVGGSSDGGLGKLAEAGLPAVVDGSYMEEDPLGRAEWIRFTAAFFGREAEADSIFAATAAAYRDLAGRVARAVGAGRRPKVVVGAPFGGVWWMPGGRTYVARLLADAGADYPWAGDTTRGSLPLDLEAVYAKAGDADFWLNAGEWADAAAARASDSRIALFRAWSDGGVWNNDGVACPGGGRDFYETGAARPDLVLADLVSILHPELLPGHARRWYRRLPGPDTSRPSRVGGASPSGAGAASGTARLPDRAEAGR